MTLKPEDLGQIPDQTARIAKAAFPKGNPYLKLRDELQTIYADEEFAELFAKRGQPAESPGRLAIITVLQFAEGLSDRQAADAVRSRIDWKYLLGLELADPGFDYSILSEFRARLINGQMEQRLLDRLLERLKAQGLLRERGRQRTDSTYVEGSIRQLNRLERVGETLRYALNSLAVEAPDWLQARVPPEWYTLYGSRFDEYRLPKKEKEREQLAIQIGRDGRQLLEWVYLSETPVALKKLSAVEVLRRVWIQEYYQQDDDIQWRKPDNMPPSEKTIHSPYDPEARYGTKRENGWIGYKAHFSESCDENLPRIITNVETTSATIPDYHMTLSVHASLKKKGLLPQKHLVDTGYVDAHNLVVSQRNYKVQLVGHPMPDTSWQAKNQKGFDLSYFQIDWQKQKVSCPMGKQSQKWYPDKDDYGHPMIHVRFDRQDCAVCQVRENCTRSVSQGRTIRLRTKAEHKALQKLRQMVKTDEFITQYRNRAGIEGTLSRAVRKSGLHRARYVGHRKTHLQHILTAIAINLVRLAEWFFDMTPPRTRVSAFSSLVIA
jgi:transposase